MDNDLPDVVGEVKVKQSSASVLDGLAIAKLLDEMLIASGVEPKVLLSTTVNPKTNRSANDPIEPPVSAGYNGEEDLTVEEGCSTKNTRTDEVLTPGLIVTLNCLPRFDTKLNNSDINGLPQSLDLSLLQV
ncbi:hypothetical protein HID58_053185 [Brassica napus]|uniref:Uncharacterized protein n=1 Tax=Brassica napus TaxID=3708 RepID=A0ABQ8AE09_BRANA|nr:hypothetical protein HID58_053185 [Brassica napus]